MFPTIADSGLDEDIQQGYRLAHCERRTPLDEFAEAALDGTRKECSESLTSVPPLVMDDFWMPKLPLTAAIELLEIVVRCYEGPARHGHLLKCRPRSWRTKTALPAEQATGVKQFSPGRRPLAGFEAITEIHRHLPISASNRERPGSGRAQTSAFPPPERHSESPSR